MKEPLVDRLLENMTAEQFTEWIAYFKLKDEEDKHRREVAEKDTKAAKAAKRGFF
jgi:hypothetical protein